MKEDLKKKDCYVAYHHFPPPIRHLLPSFAKGKGVKKLDLYRIPPTIARECGLTDTDVCKISGTNSNENTYFPSPVARLRYSMSAVAEAEEEHQPPSHASHVPSNAEFNIPFSRKTPRSRERDRLARETTVNPMAAAACIQAQSELMLPQLMIRCWFLV